MAALKSGSTMDGTAIKTTSSSWAASELDASGYSPTLTYKFLRYGKAGKFAFTDTVDEPLASAYGIERGVTLRTKAEPPYATGVGRLDEFPFTAPFVTSTDAGTLPSFRDRRSAATGSSLTKSYTAGGWGPSTSYTNEIRSFPVSLPAATDTDEGNITHPQGRRGAAGAQSDTEMWYAGGFSPGLPVPQEPLSPYTNRIESFPFSSPFSTATDEGNLTGSRSAGGGVSSATDGYCVAGTVNPSTTYTAEATQYPFSTPFVTATDAGDVSAFSLSGGMQSSTDGWALGTYNPSPYYVQIHKFPFSSPFVSAFQGYLYPTGPPSSTLQINGVAANLHCTIDQGWVAGTDPGTFLEVRNFPFTAPFSVASDVGDLSGPNPEAPNPNHMVHNFNQ